MCGRDATPTKRHALATIHRWYDAGPRAAADARVAYVAKMATKITIRIMMQMMTQIIFYEEEGRG